MIFRGAICLKELGNPSWIFKYILLFWQQRIQKAGLFPSMIFLQTLIHPFQLYSGDDGYSVPGSCGGYSGKILLNLRWAFIEPEG